MESNNHVCIYLILRKFDFAHGTKYPVIHLLNPLCEGFRCPLSVFFLMKQQDF